MNNRSTVAMGDSRDGFGNNRCGARGSETGLGFDGRAQPHHSSRW